MQCGIQIVLLTGTRRKSGRLSYTEVSLLCRALPMPVAGLITNLKPGTLSISNLNISEDRFMSHCDCNRAAEGSKDHQAFSLSSFIIRTTPQWTIRCLNCRCAGISKLWRALFDIGTFGRIMTKVDESLTIKSSDASERPANRRCYFLIDNHCNQCNAMNVVGIHRRSVPRSHFCALAPHPHGVGVLRPQVPWRRATSVSQKSRLSAAGTQLSYSSPLLQAQIIGTGQHAVASKASGAASQRTLRVAFRQMP